MDVTVCHDRRALRSLLSRQDRPKFVEQRVDFWDPYKTSRNDAEMRSYGAVLSRARKIECDSRGVLARRARSAFLSRYGRSKIVA